MVKPIFGRSKSPATRTYLARVAGTQLQQLRCIHQHGSTPAACVPSWMKGGLIRVVPEGAPGSLTLLGVDPDSCCVYRRLEEVVCGWVARWLRGHWTQPQNKTTLKSSQYSTEFCLQPQFQSPDRDIFSFQQSKIISNSSWWVVNIPQNSIDLGNLPQKYFQYDYGDNPRQHYLTTYQKVILDICFGSRVHRAYCM